MKIEKEKISAEKVVFDEISDENLRSRETIYERILPINMEDLEFNLVLIYSDFWAEAEEGQDNNYFLKSFEIIDDEMNSPIQIPPLNQLGGYTLFAWLEKELFLYLISQYGAMANENRTSKKFIQERVDIVVEKVKEILRENDIDY